MELSDPEIWNIREALLTARDEMQELMRAKDWFVSDSIDLIDTALEIVGREKEEE